MGYVSDWIWERPGTIGGDDAIREKEERHKRFPYRSPPSDPNESAKSIGCLVIIIIAFLTYNYFYPKKSVELEKQENAEAQRTVEYSEKE